MATMEQKAPGIRPGGKPKTYKNFIGGEWVASRTGHTFENLNPADTREVVGVFQKSDKQDVDLAMDAAKQAFKKWRLVPAPRRAEMLYKASEILIARKEEYAQQMTPRGTPGPARPRRAGAMSGQGPSGSVSAHRHSAMVCRRCRAAAACLSAAVISRLLVMARFMTGCPDHGPPGTITRPR